MSGQDEQRWDDLIERTRGSLGAMVEKFLARAMADPSYADSELTAEDLRRSSAESFTAILDSLRSDGTTSRLVAVAESLGTRRARQAVPLDSLLRAIRLDFTVLWEHLAESSSEVDPALLVRRAGCVWTTVDEFAAHVQEHYLAEQLAIEQANADLQRQYLSQLFAPSRPTEAALERIAGALRVPLTGNFCVAAASREDGAVIRRRIRGAARSVWTPFAFDMGHHTLFIWPTDEVALRRLSHPARELFAGLMVAVAPVARGLARIRESAAAAREIMIDLPMDSTGVATLSDRWRSVTRHLLAGVGCDLGQIVFPYLENCTELERRKILETVSTYLETGSLGDTGRAMNCHRNTVLNRLNAFERYTGLDVQRPYDAAAVIIALEWL
ncbi:helix-turn-helix domain-containing protein [Streptomyces sp. HNM0663]|uniref:Helix-turn-helix domain-containing protein n=1 Tax=Streptomyces chengmaiensis TaxID=3040919 RepID=A0ABT6HT63_9ACTN|nr:helix-turn-helix domain-containing protein [Streptomyces chengmaiensis]MDH2391896.1 helix-turn-helix domain-containing protein [Streptomyces chengmaiensis]